jgi:type IV secretory pathway VirB4 component
MQQEGEVFRQMFSLTKRQNTRQPEISNEPGRWRSLTDNVADLKSLIAPDGIDCYPDHLLVGPSRYCRVYALYVYPRQISIGWLDDVFMLGDIDVSIHIDPVPDRFVIRKLTEIVTSHQAQHSVLSKQGNILMLPDLENAISDNEIVREAIQTNRDKMFYASIFIAVHADSEEELNKKCDSVEDVLARKAARAYSLMFRQLDGLKSCFPGGSCQIHDFSRNLTTGGVAAMFPVSNPDVSHPSGIYLGPSYFTGSPVVYDQFIGPPALPNPHIAVFGYSGSGKSVTLKTMTARSALIGERIVILDLMGEYESMVLELLNGKVVHIAAGRESGMNPLEIEAETDDHGKQVVDLHDKVAEIRALFTVISRAFNGNPLQAQDAAILEEAVREEYASRGITSDPRSLYTRVVGSVGPVKKRAPTLSDLYRRLVEKPVSSELREVLKPFLRGNSLGIFDCETAFSLSDQVVSFDFSEIKDEFTKLYAEFGVLAWVRQKFVQQNRRLKKKFIVDEGWHFIKFPESAVALETVARTGRKHNCGLVVASQFIEEFLGREEGRAVIGNCATLFLLRQHDTVIDQVVDAFHLSSGTKNFLGGFAPGECLMSLNGAVTAVRIEPTPFEWPYMNTNPQQSAG